MHQKIQNCGETRSWFLPPLVSESKKVLMLKIAYSGVSAKTCHIDILTAIDVAGRNMIVMRASVFIAELSLLVSSAILLVSSAMSMLMRPSRCCMKEYNYDNQCHPQAHRKRFVPLEVAF